VSVSLFSDTMLKHCATLALGSLISLVSANNDLDLSEFEEEGDPRLLFANFTSSLIAVNSTLLAYALVGLALAGAAGLALYYLYLQSASSSGGYGQYSQYGYNQYNYQSRSSDAGFDFNAVNILAWISMLQEVYEKFDYNDVDCQKLLICEVLRDEESFGEVSARLQNGFQLAKYLEVLNLPDDFRELLDEYLDASERSLGQKECREYFQCPYSLSDSVKRNFSGNSL